MNYHPSYHPHYVSVRSTRFGNRRYDAMEEELPEEEQHCLEELVSAIPPLTDGEDTIRLKHKTELNNNKMSKHEDSKQSDNYSIKTDDDDSALLAKESPNMEVPGPLRWCSDLHLREEFTFDSPSPTPSARDKGTIRSAFSLSITSMGKV